MSFTIVDSAATPDGTVLVLCKEDDIWEVRVDEHLLMASDDHVSEDALASLALAHLAKVPAPRVLIGGLGLGFTLRKALDLVGSDAVVVVAEMNPVLVQWNRTLVADAARRPLDDPRARVHHGDVGAAIRDGKWDAIVLDVDNGPEALVHEHNSGLYDAAGLAAARAALNDGGVFAVWSAGADDGFVARMRDAGFDDVRAVAIDDAYDTERHVVFVGRKP